MNKKRIESLLDLHPNMINSLNLMGLAITTWGVMYFLPEEHQFKKIFLIAVWGFVILGLFQFILSINGLFKKSVN